MWEIAMGMVILTLKPHIIFLPALFLGFELVRKKNWQTIVLVLGTISLLALASSTLLYKNWFPALLNAIFVDQKYLGGSDLAASFHQSFSSVGISIFVFIPLIIYLIFLWATKGINFYFFSLITTANFLIMPYTRQYDFVILLPVYFYLFAQMIKHHHYLSVIIFILLIYFLPFLTMLSFLTPAIILGCLLFYPPDKINGKQHET